VGRPYYNLSRSHPRLPSRKPRNASTDRPFNTRLASFSYLQIGMFQVLAGFLAFLIILLDFGLAPSASIGLDDYGFLSFVKEEEHRWIFTRTQYKGKASGAA
jgi:hypothetical protein